MLIKAEPSITEKLAEIKTHSHHSYPLLLWFVRVNGSVEIRLLLRYVEGSEETFAQAPVPFYMVVWYVAFELHVFFEWLDFPS